MDATNQFGIVVSSQACYTYLAKLTEFLGERQTKFFTKQTSCLFLIDNYSVGRIVKDIRGGHLNAKLEGT